MQGARTPEFTSTVEKSARGDTPMTEAAAMEKWRSLLAEFAQDSNRLQWELPDISSFERRIAHACAEELGLPHASQGRGGARRLWIGKPGSRHPGHQVIEKLVMGKSAKGGKAPSRAGPGKHHDLTSRLFAAAKDGN